MLLGDTARLAFYLFSITRLISPIKHKPVDAFLNGQSKIFSFTFKEQLYCP